MLSDLKWMKEMEAGMQSVPGQYKKLDRGDVAQDEQVIGTVPDALLPMLYLVEQRKDESKQLKAKHDKVKAEGGDCNLFHDMVTVKDAECQNLQSFLSVLLRTELGLPFGKVSRLGIRNGLKVVTWEHVEDGDITAMIQQILGGGKIRVAPMGGGMSDLGLGPQGD